jgi:hypothetical protein
VLQLWSRWCSTRIGEGLIYDMRSQVYTHISAHADRLLHPHPDRRAGQPAQQRRPRRPAAFTGTLSGVVSNVIGVVLTLAAMLVLSWQITLLSLVLLPVFVIPAKLIGTKLQALTRESYALNAAMTNTMTERFNVSGALLVKLFGRPEVEESSFRDKAGRVRDIGITSAMYGRVFFVSLTTVAALATAMVYGVGGVLAAPARSASARCRARGLPHPAVRAAHRAVQRPGRRDDGAGQLRAGLRGARPRADGADRRARSALPRGARSVEFDDVVFATRRPSRCRWPRWSRSRCSTRRRRPPCCTASRSAPSPGSWSRWSARPAPARRPSASSSPGCTTCRAARCASAGTTSAT